MTASSAQPRATHWLSRDLTAFADELAAFAGGDPCHCDVVIVGSGYGGAMALQAFAGHADAQGRPLRIALLERGQEYLPGAFPSRLAELPGHVRFSVQGQPRVRGRETGLFDLRVGGDMGAVVANGLGGGSLINAGVLAEPLPEVLAEAAWPRALREEGDLPRRMSVLKQQLGATSAFAPDGQRTAAIDRLGPSEPCEVTVATQDDAARGIAACNGCADCATGCNFGAKLSLDVGPLAAAAHAHDPQALRIVTGASVRSFVADGEGWALTVESTSGALRRRAGRPLALRTRHLVLCAGALGSTELLLRARAGGLPVSSALGKHFSGNGDHIVLLHGTEEPTGANADEAVPFADRRHGPTITRTLDLRRAAPQCVIQDLAVPGPLHRLLEETAVLCQTLAAQAEVDERVHRAGQASAPGPESLPARGVTHSMALAVLTRDSAGGEVVLPEAADADAGTASIHWQDVQHQPALETLHARVAALAARGHPGARLLASPLWRPFPPALESREGHLRGPLLTVHPLGGCRMADDAADGVVNHLGQVFRATAGSAVYANLVVLDGAIVPTALGINPALTIAALAQRAALRLRERWGFRPAAMQSGAHRPRPVFRVMPAAQPVAATQFELTERMEAQARLRGSGATCKVSLELWTQPFSLQDIAGADSSRVLQVDARRSRLRIVQPPPELAQDDVTFGADAAEPATGQPLTLWEAPLSGEMQLFVHAPSTPGQRILRTAGAYFGNHGATAAWELFRGLLGGSAGGLGAARATASRAGDLRSIDYRLRVEAPPPSPGAAPAATPPAALPADAQSPPTPTVPPDARPQGALALTKVLGYERAGNPLMQLMHAQLLEFPRTPGLALTSGFSVDLPYFGRMGVPLLRIVRQQDHARALVDAARLLAYTARVLLPLHQLGLRRPDRPRGTLPEDARLPRPLPGLPAPSVVHLCLGGGVAARLTHYPPAPGVRPRARPVLLIHGYSASGTTFAHEVLPAGGLAGTLCRRGHHCWVLDLRTSAGLRTGDDRWTFEQVGCEDIPAAVAHVHAHHGSPVDIVAHCMGGPMLALGLFGQWPDDAFAAFKAERAAMAQRIARIVFSQAGPALVMAPANTARAHAAQWLEHYLTFGRFEFRPSGGRWEDMLDRLLRMVPYERRDFRRENPWWPWQARRWVAQRHRMDALYGITFDLEGMPERVLDRIDDFFGPMHLDTAAQTIWFARARQVTDRHGERNIVLPDRMAALAHCRVLALHGERNGLLDRHTREVLAAMLAGKVAQLRSVLLRGIGHQDSLIGRRAPRVYDLIANFLEE